MFGPKGRGLFCIPKIDGCFFFKKGGITYCNAMGLDGDLDRQCRLEVLQSLDDLGSLRGVFSVCFLNL